MSRSSKSYQGTQHNDVAGYARTKNQTLRSSIYFFHPTCFCETHFLSSVIPQAAEEDVGTATSGDRAEFLDATNLSDNTGALKLESISSHRQRLHHFLVDLKAALPNTRASPTLLKLSMLEAENFLHKMLTPGGGLHADAGMNLIFENDDTLFAE